MRARVQPEWDQVPGPPPVPQHPARDERGWPHVLVAVGCTLGPAMRASSTSSGRAALVAGIALLGLAVAVQAPEHERARRLATAALAGALVAVAADLWTGIWVALAIPLAEWAVLHRDLSSSTGREPRQADALPGAVVLTIVAMLRATGAGIFPVGITAGALTLTWVANRHGEQFERAVDAVRRWAGLAARTVLFGLLGIVALIPGWAVARLSRVDPLAAPTRLGDTNWIPLERSEVRPARPWALNRPAAPIRRWPILRRRAVTALVAVAVIGGMFLARVEDDLDSTERSREELPAAVADAHWWPDYVDQMNWAFFDPAPAFNPLRYPEMADVHTPFINVEHGRRRSWTPPECACRVVTVWLYGGSAMAGLGQRDDHTIPSELAKLAWRDGIAVEVHNRGVLGDLHWEEAQRFAWDVETDPAPDLVVFYSGSNDVVGAQYREATGAGLDDTPVDWTAEGTLDSLKVDNPLLVFFSQLFAEDPPEGATTPPTTVAPRLGPEDLGAHVTRQYERARQVAIRAAADRGISAHWFWQPSRHTRRVVEGEPLGDATFDRFQRRTYRAATSALSAEVTDLSGAFDDVDGPLFYDDVHTNEEGAAIIAREIYARLDDELRAVVDAAEEGTPSQANG